QALTDAAALDQLDEDLAAHRHVYHAVFMADGQEVASIPFTIDSEPITAPEAPVLDNRTFTGWTPAIPTQMPAEDLRFDAVYQENAGLTITDNAKEQGDDRVIGYKETVKFSTDPSALPADVKLMWYVDGRESSMGLNATVEKPQEDYTIQVKALRADGSVYAESEVQTVKVDQSFWAKLLDLLRSLFEWLVSAVKNIVGAVAGGF
ncbi:MAG: PKD domain-containing protein, partial [Clostridia bacterium]|nr:PKD domain-containing protein [Clostridia bacterium]